MTINKIDRVVAIVVATTVDFGVFSENARIETRS